ncbi:MAG: hypothetical protein QME16_00040 [Planctomycetota bacterium]|nr:hypothetical protein [Planctomycetota bacterium]
MDSNKRVEITCPFHQRQGLFKELVDGKWYIKCLCAGCNWEGISFEYHSELEIPTKQELKDEWK